MDLSFKLRHKNDEQFVSDLFFEHKVVELNANDWPNVMKKQLIGMQFSAFEKSIYSEYPSLKDKIVCLDSNPIGRIAVNTTASEINLLYISILRKFQGREIGKMILKRLIKESEQQEKSFILKVSKENPIIKLYLKMGFSITDEDATKYTMIHSI